MKILDMYWQHRKLLAVQKNSYAARKKTQFKKKKKDCLFQSFHFHLYLMWFRPKIIGSGSDLSFHQVGIKCSIHIKPFILYPLNVDTNDPQNL